MCRHLGLHRSTFAYESKESSIWISRLRGSVRKLSELHTDFGTRKIGHLLRKGGWRVGNQLVGKLRREMGLLLIPKKAKKRRQGVSTGLPTTATHRNHVWTWDFVQDRTVRGGTIRMLTVLDEYTRECRTIYVDRNINAKKVQEVMKELVEKEGVPEYIRSDNGSEFIEKNLRSWLRDASIKTIYIDPGSPWQNGYIESFNGRLREECLNREQFWSLSEARVVIDDWKWKYNHIRPHGSLGMLTPVEFAHKEIAPSEGGACFQAAPSSNPLLDSTPEPPFSNIFNLFRLTHAVAQF